jgi:hypothetical protein
MHSRTASDIVEDFLSCPCCDRIFQTITPVHPPTDDPASPSPSSRSRTGTPSKNKKYRETHKGTKGKDASGFEPHTVHSEWLEMSDNRPEEFPLTASAKTTALKALLLRGFTEAPFDKVRVLPSLLPIDPNYPGTLLTWRFQVVIYVQFRQLARIVGRICQSEGWPFLYLTGDRALEDRSKVIARFRDDKSIKILIAGLKCGGLGYVPFPSPPHFSMPNLPHNSGTLENRANVRIVLTSYGQTAASPLISGGTTPSNSKHSAASSVSAKRKIHT